jgi:hypothetical protein
MLDVLQKFLTYGMSCPSGKAEKPVIGMVVETQHPARSRGVFQHYRVIALID